MPSYNLVDEKWIPCVLNGNPYECGLYEILVRAHEISEIYDPSPLVTLALHRLLLAILHRNFGPPDPKGWQQLWQAGRWDREVLQHYFAKWRHRFDLFDQQRPFYQVPLMQDERSHPVTRLFQELSFGHNATLFDHSYDSAAPSVPASVAARYLVATQAFAIGFGKSRPFYFKDAPLTRGFCVLVMGNNLFETLLLNMVPYNANGPFPVSGKDEPIWEADQLPQPNKSGSPIKGYLDYLTWQSRAIHLFPESNGVSVRYCQFRQNLALPDIPYFDPLKCYQKDKERGWKPLSLHEERAVWRDSHTLLQRSDPNIKRPGVIDFLAQIEEQRGGSIVRASHAYRLSLVGMASEPGKAANIVMWRHERLPLPSAYLVSEDLLAALRKALDIAERVEETLRHTTQQLARELIGPQASTLDPQQKENVKNLTNHLSPAHSYWAKLGILFPELVEKLAQDLTVDGDLVRYGDKVIPWWATEVRQVALSVFRSTIDSLNHSARALKAATVAEAQLYSGLKRALDSF